jgi:hypothetical protein
LLKKKPVRDWLTKGNTGDRASFHKKTQATPEDDCTWRENARTSCINEQEAHELV